jgi:hypothetical protein
VTRSTSLVVRCCFWLLCCSIGYGLCLLLSIPGQWSLIPIILCAWFCFRKLDLPHEAPVAETRNSAIASLMLLAGLLLVLDGALVNISKHGHWDAWWFWNPRAAFLSSPEHWRRAFSGDTAGTPFTVPVAHSDYPPFLPLLNALAWSGLRMQPTVIPALLNITALILCCSVMFLELARRNAVIAGICLFFFAQQTHLLELGVAQTADTWISLFLLLAVISGNAGSETRNSKYWLTAGLALGCGIWMKNEGILIALCFATVSIKAILADKKGLRNLIAGMAIPLTAFLLFKVFIAPKNDLVAGISQGLSSQISDPARYRDIWKLPKEQIALYFPALPWLLLASLLSWIITKAKPGRYLFMLILIWCGYAAIYLLSPHHLGWHINTSADRLLSQLYPSLMYILALQLCSIRFRVDRSAAR